MSAFNGVKVIAATMFHQRQSLGEDVTRWLEEARARPGFRVVDIQIRQSSDDAYHCVSACIFFHEDVAVPKGTKRRG